MNFGNPDPTGTAGITFTHSASTNYTPSGSFEWVQMIDPVSSDTLTDSDINTHTISFSSGEDTSFPYPGSSDSGGANGTPCTNLHSYGELKYVASRTYEMYLLYTPSGSNSIPVPVSVVKWSWGGTATNTVSNPQDPALTAVWSLSNPSNSQNPAGSSTDTFQTWTGISQKSSN